LFLYHRPELLPKDLKPRPMARCGGKNFVGGKNGAYLKRKLGNL
jgi:hypothetical protein